MVTNAVNTDLKVNAQGGTKQRENSGGFSEMLGNVRSDGERRQQGLSNSSRKDFGKEFKFTGKASESVRNASDDVIRGDSTDTGGFVLTQEQLKRMETVEQAADKLLTEAAETVTRTVAESGEAPTKEAAAEMMSEALRELAPKKDVPVLTEEEKTTGELAEVLADLIAAMAGEPEETQVEQVAVNEEDAPVKAEEPSIHVITPDSSFVMTEKHVEAAIISGGNEFEAAETDESGGFSQMLGMMIPDGEMMRADDAELLAFTENAREMFTGRTQFANEDYTDRSDLLTKMLDKLGTEVTDSGEPITDIPAVQDTLKMLSEMITEAKQKLGLSDVKYEHVVGEQDAAAPLMQDESAKLSRSMNRSDMTGELDHILNEGRSDVTKPEEGAPKTETYDAVHLAAHVTQERTDTHIPVERASETAENTEVRPPEIQTAQEILERIQSMQDDHTEFTMVLNPESLGRITVRLVMAGEKTAVEITAENPETRAILASRSDNLQSMLRENGVELERYQVVSEQEDARFEQQSYEGSSKNPYSRHENGGEEEKKDENGESFYDLLGQL